MLSGCWKLSQKAWHLVWMSTLLLKIEMYPNINSFLEGSFFHCNFESSIIYDWSWIPKTLCGSKSGLPKLINFWVFRKPFQCWLRIETCLFSNIWDNFCNLHTKPKWTKKVVIFLRHFELQLVWWNNRMKYICNKIKTKDQEWDSGGHFF